MSILGSSSGMGKPLFSELKKQASFFFKEKIKTARLALTDVTPAELLTEEVTRGNPWAPDTPAMGLISKAAFEVDDFWRIVEILHRRLAKFDEKNWRVSHNSIILLEHLLTHGPESAAEEFQADKDVIREMESFQFVDEKGFDWGLAVRRKSERVLRLLEKGPLLKQERDRARKLTRGIQGFGSVSVSAKSADEDVLRDSGAGTFRRCCTEPKDREKQEIDSANSLSFHPVEKPGQTQNWSSEADLVSKENVAPVEDRVIDESRSCVGESRPFLEGRKDDALEGLVGEDEHHPFNVSDRHATKSLL
uniref:ENTH domain-containing protein n=1 Tax=Kalanchoe fedtschenkoi TaxID=63787 RepID=A0A7N0UL69_KALFE